MVVFTCQHCNDALKKSVVEKHYNTKCRRNPYLTCVDCLKDFRGDEYISHTSCVSEDQRYGDKNFVPKPVAVKQNNWLDAVHCCINNNTNPKYFSSFQRLINCSNIPRKKPKFLNFMKNAMNLQNTTLCEEMFDLFQKEFENFNSNKNKFKGNNNSKIPNESEEASKNTQEYQCKKKRNHLSETEIKVEENMNCQVEQKKKKSKKQRSDSLSKTNKPFTKVDSVSNGPVGTEDPIDDKNNEKKKKKKKNATQDKENLEESYVVENEASLIDEIPEANSIIQNLKDTGKVSKKELKKLKKKQKFETELKSIEAEKHIESNELQEEIPCEQSVVESKSKKKKRKARLSESEPDQMKKQRTEGTIEPELTESILIDSGTEESNRKVKFQWDEVIKQILHNSSDHEISLKRLTKKVLIEYQSVKGNRESYEEFMSKFNKKVSKIPGVKIIKDKARLIV